MKTSIKNIALALLLSLSLHGLALGAVVKDVKSTDPRFNSISELTQNNAIAVDRQGKFNPDQQISRAEFLKALFDYAGFTIKTPLRNPQIHKDVPTDSPFAPYINKGVSMQLFPLQENFGLNNSITRAEALKFTLEVYGIPTPYSEPKSSDLYKDIKTTASNSYIYAAAKKAGISFSSNPNSFLPNKILTKGDAAELLYKAKNNKSSSQVSTINVNSPSTTNTTLPFDTTSSSRQKLFNNPKFNDFLQTWDKINDQYIYTNKTKVEDLLQGAISGMVGTLDDPYSVYFDPKDSTSFYSTLKGQFEGIGTMIENRDQNYIVQDVLTESPAEKAGIKPQDIVLEVDGKSLKDLQPAAVTSLIQGKAGTTVKLKIQRGNQTLNFSIQRAVITIESVHSKILDGNIGYINIDEFSQNSDKLFDKAVAKIMKNNPDKLIIDLRNNPGGYVDATQRILNHFITKDQTIFFTENLQKELQTYKSQGPADLKNLKTVVLIDQYSASASEIFAGALQDLKIAKIVGTTSYGKGSVQEVNTFGDESSLKISIGNWLTPNRRNIDKIGITPDIDVKITNEDIKAGRDPQLDAAIKAVKEA